MNHNDAILTLVAELRMQIAASDDELAAVRAKNDELHTEITARDAKILDLEHHLAVVERDAALHGISG